MQHSLSNKEVLQLVEKLYYAEGTEEEQDVWKQTLEKNVPYYKELMRLIFWGTEDLTTEEILKKAMNNKPLILP